MRELFSSGRFKELRERANRRNPVKRWNEMRVGIDRCQRVGLGRVRMFFFRLGMTIGEFFELSRIGPN